MEHLIRKTKHRRLRHILSIPFIYMMFIPAVFIDISVFIFNHICFRLYAIPLVQRRHYVKVDRHKLAYLTPIQKLNCVYCGYVNGVFAYAVRIAGDTEKYWCGIQHQKDPFYGIPPHHKDFLEYGNEKQFEEYKKRDKNNFDKS